MTPEDLGSVQRSWAEFVRRRASLLEVLAARFDLLAPPSDFTSAQRAEWLFSAVAALVDLLSAPSCLADCARRVGATWPDPLTAPCFAVEGRAWMSAADECITAWSPSLEASWRQAWWLLSDVLAAETLSPFSDVTAQVTETVGIADDGVVLEPGELGEVEVVDDHGGVPSSGDVSGIGDPSHQHAPHTFPSTSRRPAGEGSGGEASAR